MAMTEGFARLRKVLAIGSVLWLAAFAAFAFALMGSWVDGVVIFAFAAIPVGIAWALLWVVEGFMLKRDKP